MTKLLLDINVTEAHITDGDKGECKTCPIALALIDALADIGITPEAVRVYGTVGVHVALREYGSALFTPYTPDVAREFISDFDNDQPVEPFSFTLELEAG